MFAALRRDIRTVLERDPAARSGLEVLLCYPGVHALGADLGGRSLEEATRAVETQFAEYARQPITLEVASQQFFLTAGELGVRFDARATAERAMQVGRSGSIPRQLFDQARGLALERDTPLVYQIDDERMQTALTPLAQRVEATTGAVSVKP